MLHDTQRTSAPSAVSVSIRTAVWIVMCSEPAIRAPLSGCDLPYSSRVAIRPGISVSAMLISLRPNSARPMSATMYSEAALVGFFAAAALMAGPWLVLQLDAQKCGWSGAAYSRAGQGRQSLYKESFMFGDRRRT